MGYRDSDDSDFSRHGMGRDHDDGRHSERYAERGYRQSNDHSEPRTGYRPELDDRTDRYGQYGMVRGGSQHAGDQGYGGQQRYGSSGSSGYPQDRHSAQSSGAYRNDGRQVSNYQQDRFDGGDGRSMNPSQGYGGGGAGGYRNEGGGYSQGYGQGYGQGYDRGYGQESGYGRDSQSSQFSQSNQSHRDPDYHQWRQEQMRLLDDDYHAWRSDRYQKFSEDFNQWRTHRASRSTTGSDTQQQPGQKSGGSNSRVTSAGASTKSKDQN